MGPEKIISGVNMFEELLVPEVSKSELITTVITSVLCVLAFVFLFCFYAFIAPQVRQEEKGSEGTEGKLKHAAFLAFTGLVCILAVFLLLLSVAQKVQGYRTLHSEYIVTLTDAVDLDEFNAKYDIVSVDGSTYTIRLREKDTHSDLAEESYPSNISD